MFIELTRTTGTILKVNVLSIDAVESGSRDGFFSSSNTSVSIGSATYYIEESYSEVVEKIDKACVSIPSEVINKKYI